MMKYVLAYLINANKMLQKLLNVKLETLKKS